MWYVRDVLYAVLYVRVSCFVVRGCGVSRRYIDVCYCDMFSVVNVYLDHLKFCVVCINSRRYVCCSECNVVSNECNEPTSCLVQPFGTHCCEVMCFGFRGELGFLNCVLPIPWGQGECWTCVCVLVAVVGRGPGPGSGAVGWCYVCVRYKSGLSV